MLKQVGHCSWPFCFVGFGTDRLRCEQAMKTAGRENPNRCAKVAGNRAPGADGQNRSSSIKWAAKQEKFRPMRKPFIEPIRSWQLTAGEFVADEKLRVAGRS